MKKFCDKARVVSIALMSALTSLVSVPFVRAQERGPLNLARASYFFVGGKMYLLYAPWGGTYVRLQP